MLFTRFHGKRPRRELEVSEIRTYLSYLATEKDVATSTQNVALSALLFLYQLGFCRLSLRAGHTNKRVQLTRLTRRPLDTASVMDLRRIDSESSLGRVETRSANPCRVLRQKTVRARRPKRSPSVSARDETLEVIARMSGRTQLVGKLLYGAPRLADCVRLCR